MNNYPVMEKLDGVFINGKKVSTNQILDLYNPANIDERVGKISTGEVSHVKQSIEAAEEAWKTWKEVPIEKRLAYLSEVANYIESNLSSLSELLVLEHGKTLEESSMDLKAAVGVLRYYASLNHALDEEVVENEQGKMVLKRQPVGVVSVIVPWNFPIILSFLMLAPSILAGNTVVIKPPSFAPMTLTKILTHFAEQLPKGVLNIVLGSGSTIGKEMTEHPRVRKIAFTGSTETGRTIMKGASNTIKKLSMELGGNDAAVFLKDQPITDKLIEDCIKATFTACGQICYSIKRVYVPSENYELFIKKFTEAMENFKVGSGLDPDVDMGPINNKPQYDSILRLLEKTKKRGSEIKELGTYSSSIKPERGYFLLPMLVTNVSNTDPIVQEEQFGPILPVVKYSTEEEALELVNNTEFGLANSVWSPNEEKAFEFASHLQSGSVFINTHRVGASAANMPFGGFKQSGIGRSHGMEAIYEHTELQAIIRRSDM
ncbi:aldehyde dehydrogenase family protein [Alkalicoccus saliphilus]|uniref:Aldehyde dehydrogenase n=1 Tax=Alkalicoccus saliphilus TaxID=200989 RepID=A0A2T4U3V9_9BACI|nr:aldehyde dehydrogenase family protein [Alkalicoccus saliphilus]PTL38087.1 aldehyde dehydrogenase [Alkalicoccus saliphilus]